MELVYLLLTVTTLVLGSTLTLLGVQFFLILRELEDSLKKTNLLLDDLQKFSRNVASVSGEARNLFGSLPLKSGSFLAVGLTAAALLKNLLIRAKKVKSDE